MKAPRTRRRRFLERDLLDRIQGYENLLQQNNIDFEPLHARKVTPNEIDRNVETTRLSESTPSEVPDKEGSMASPKTEYEPKYDHWPSTGNLYMLTVPCL